MLFTSITSRVKMNIEPWSEENPFDDYYSNIEVFSMGIFRMLCVVGLILNSLILVAFVKHKLYARANNVQLFSLALDDFGTALWVELMVILSYMKPSAFADKTWLFRLFSSLIHTFPWGSTLSILILSVTRVITIIFPVHYKELITTRRMYIALAGKYLILLGFVSISNPFWASKFSMKYKQCFVNYNHLGEKPGSRVEWEGLDHNITVPILHVTVGIIIFLINMVVVCMLFRIKLKKLGKMPKVFRAGVELVLLVAAYMITTISIPAIFIRYKI